MLNLRKSIEKEKIILKFKEVIQLLEDEEKSILFKESSSSSKSLHKEVTKKSTPNVLFEITITGNEQSYEESTSGRTFEELTSRKSFGYSSYQISQK